MSSGLVPEGRDQSKSPSHDDVRLMRDGRDWRFWLNGRFVGPRLRWKCCAVAYAQSRGWRNVV